MFFTPYCTIESFISLIWAHFLQHIADINWILHVDHHWSLSSTCRVYCVKADISKCILYYSHKMINSYNWLIGWKYSLQDSNFLTNAGDLMSTGLFNTCHTIRQLICAALQTTASQESRITTTPTWSLTRLHRPISRRTLVQSLSSWSWPKGNNMYRM